MDRPFLYLYIPEDYCRPLGGLRWSASGEAVEIADGKTFAFAAEAVLLIEGFASQRPLAHFAHMLHLLGMLKGCCCSLTNPAEVHRLSTVFRAAGKNHRNAGVFFAVVCADVPAAADPPSAATVEQRVSLRMLGLAAGAPATPPAGVEKPPLGPAVFEAKVLRATAAFPDETLRHWFRHGRGPVEQAADGVADAVRHVPRTLADALDEAVRRQRLAGAAAFVEQLTSALTLPPRRLARPDVPMGGYADVTTHGGPEQILPSQFALDDLEFIRRLAERELLYYRREEPQDRTREDLVVLLDQGVRTWGQVRLVLSAAVIALGRLAGSRRLPFLIAATSAGGAVLDPLEISGNTLAALLECSDLTADPALALEQVLEAPTETARDVVLLTQPRNLFEPDVRAAARRLRPGSRLFAVAVDDHGDVEFSELRHGAPVRLSRFHIDLNRTAPPPPARRAAEQRAPWRGDVEANGFPFAFGVGGNGPFHFDFDHGGRYLVTATANGMLHATRTDGSGVEVLPRAVVDERLLTDVREVLGAPEGVLVCGKATGDVAVVAHYDFGRRTCVTYLLGLLHGETCKWYYFPDLHSVVLANHQAYRSVDLATGRRILTPVQPGDCSTRASEACERARRRPIPPPLLYRKPAGVSPEGEEIFLEAETGRLELHGVEPPWKSFIPLSDGRPMLRGRRIGEARRRENMLALIVDDRNGPSRSRLCLFRGPEGTPMATYTILSPSLDRFTLSGDGRLLARQVGPFQLEVRDAAVSGPPLCVTPVGGFHKKTSVVLGDRWILFRVRKSFHWLRWDRGLLVCWTRQGNAAAFLRTELARTSLSPEGVEARKGPPPAFLAHDPGRCVRIAYRRLIAAVDDFGQTAVFEPNGDLVCMFFVFEGRLAAWAPPDVRFGHVGLLGGPPTPGADEKIGGALLAAWERSEARTP